MSRILLPMSGLAFVGVLAYACGTARAEPPEATNSHSHGADSAGSRSRSEVSEAPPRALVRFVNAIPDGPALELLADSSQVAGHIEFGEVSAYKPVANQRVRYEIVTHDDQVARALGTEIMQANERYTVIALPDAAGGVTLRIIRDDLIPSSGKARVRVIHVAHALDDVDVMMTGRRAPLLERLGVGGGVAFRDIAPATAALSVTRDSSRLPLLLVRSKAMNAGASYTLILTARAGEALAGITFADTSD